MWSSESDCIAHLHSVENDLDNETCTTHTLSIHYACRRKFLAPAYFQT